MFVTNGMKALRYSTVVVGKSCKIEFQLLLQVLSLAQATFLHFEGIVSVAVSSQQVSQSNRNLVERWKHSIFRVINFTRSISIIFSL